MTNYKFCPNCGHSVPSQIHNFCGDCGFSLAPTFQTGVVTFPPITTTPLTWPPQPDVSPFTITCTGGDFTTYPFNFGQQ